eukprot:UN08928
MSSGARPADIVLEIIAKKISLRDCILYDKEDRGGLT